MVKLHTFVSSRRAYEFDVDNIRLTLLCHTSVIDELRQVFSFEYGEITQPPETFGPVSPTNPPGLVLAAGFVPDQKQRDATIRMIAIEARRVVVDVAGPSSDISLTYDRLKIALEGLVAADGGLALGNHKQIRDFSDISFRSEGMLNQIINPHLLKVFERFGGDEELTHQSFELVPSIKVKRQTVGEEYSGSFADLSTFAIDLRGGSSLRHGLLYSGAPLDSDRHLEMLREIESLWT